MTTRTRLLAAGALAAALGAACTSSAPAKKTEAPPALKHAPAAKTDPNVIEETDVYFITRYKKSEMIKVDDYHIRTPVLRVPLRFFKEDAEYYYVRTEKYSREELQAAAAERAKAEKAEAAAKVERQAEAAIAREPEHKAEFLAIPPATPSDFDAVVPARASAGVRFEKAGAGLPADGQWRQNFAIADINSDGIPDILATPPRKSSAHGIPIFLGDGKGGFARREYKFVDAAGGPVPAGVEYGGIVAADFDGDGRLDLATASHGQGVRVFLQRDGDRFEVVTEGLPPHFSSQAIAALDADGDGRMDLVVSGDGIEHTPRDAEKHQLRVYLNRGKAGFSYSGPSIESACWSYRLFPFNLEAKGTASDILTACNFFGGWGLTWKNDGKANFSGEVFALVEQSAFHVGVAPGRFGPGRFPAFADLYIKQNLGLTASGLNVYYREDGHWNKIAVWRQKNFGARLQSVAMGDIDGDGLDDLLFADNVLHKLRIFYQTADGRFLEAPADREPALGSPAADIRLADLNGDGKLDIALAESVYSENPDDRGGFEVLLNRGK
jgi:hypothetical protein